VKSGPIPRSLLPAACALICGLCCVNLARAQNSPSRDGTQSIAESKLVTLQGTVHPFAQARYDQGPVPDSFAAERMLLLLNRPPEREAGLQQFLRAVHTPGNAGYHQWITPEEFGRRFGPADSDVQIAASGCIEFIGDNHYAHGQSDLDPQCDERETFRDSAGRRECEIFATRECRFLRRGWTGCNCRLGVIRGYLVNGGEHDSEHGIAERQRPSNRPISGRVRIDVQSVHQRAGDCLGDAERV
jgi:hypothetical protein